MNINYDPFIETKYMTIFLDEIKPKTAVYRVESKSGDFLGFVKWWASWRQYCYFPAEDIIMARSCLRELCEFMDKLMEERRTEK